ncbi:hypothetical protein M408DRAFT_194520 [Serendipita vermifera MAFF 305830]|uniref:Transmembrane protein n=1 Tax=Serendipita vermifera MAFF 305830 TaxID=933852 RepID=A0A0C2XAP9_SERVB|nr:hypothetical protein M408DRAFT_194520 [Serendipita vermifera MAFF 305830]
MSDIYKVNLTWTSPLIEYAPSGAWNKAVTGQNNSTATFRFYGNGFKWFGAANASTYSIQLDGEPLTSQPRRYQLLEEGPAGLSCDETNAWDCVVLAEANNLESDFEHTLQLTTSFGQSTNRVNLLAIQTLYNTSFSSQSTVETINVPANDTSRLRYAGDWTDVQYGSEINRNTNTSGNTVSFEFKGYSVQLRGTTDRLQSPFTVSLVGNSQSVALPSSGGADGDNNCLFWYAAGLDQSTSHTVVVTNAASSGLIIKGFLVSTFVDPTNSEGGNGTGQNSSSGLSQGALAGIIVGCLLVLFALALVALLLLRVRLRRKVHVDPSNKEGNQGSAVSTLLSLRPLLGSNNHNDTHHTPTTPHEITPWIPPPGTRTPTTPQSAPLTTPSSTGTGAAALAQRRTGKQPLPLPLSPPPSTSTHSHPHSHPTPPPIDAQATHPQDVQPPSRRGSQPHVQPENAAEGPRVISASERRKAPLPIHRHEERAQSPVTRPSSLGTATGTGTASSPTAPTIEVTNVDAVVEPVADAARPSTPPPAYEPATEGSREERRSRRQLQQTISKAIQERFRVVRND